ncbi:ribosome small subunit-dependent GTPase A [Mycoplasmatota bacterium WC30]
MISKQRENSLLLGQIIAVYKEKYLVEYNENKIMMEVSGRFRYMHYLKSDFPQVGDFVKFRTVDENFGIIESICERKSVLDRLDVGFIQERQILAVNVDLVFICMSLNEDFNLKKLRNFLTLTYDSNFKTIILLTKKDLCDDIDEFIKQTKTVTDNEIFTITVYDELDIQNLKALIAYNTAVFIGSSGVGKSTIINKLIGEEHFKTKTIRLSDAQGRHATVNRELIHLETGGKVIDTPGIRIVSSYFVSEASFEDIQSLSEGCYYKDCTHNKEPGCLVQKSLQTGDLDIERYNQYLKAIRLNRFNKQREIQRQRIIDKRLRKGR